MTETLMSLAPLLILIVLMYFLMIKPQKKKDKQISEMRNSLQVGDEVITIGGICGKVVHIKDEKVIIETSADQVRIELTKWAISSNETGAQRAKEAAQKAAEAKAKAMAEKKAAKGK